MERLELAPGAVLLRYPGDDDAANRAAVAHAAQLRALPGVLDAVPAARTTLVLHEPGATLAEPAPATAVAARRHIIPLRYAADFGLRELHRSAEYRVAFIGFAPGFPYLTGLPDALARPRLATPRVRTPAGSVAVAGRYCGVYPAELPGGWHVIGRTALQLFDGESALLAAGDSVTFEEGDAPAPAPPPAAPKRLQGGPRFGRGHHGVSPGGAMDLRALEEGNRMLGNPAHAPAHELTLFGGDLVLPRDTWVCLAGAPIESPVPRGKPTFLKAGAALKLGRVLEGARAYLCLAHHEPPRGEAMPPFAAASLSLRVLRGPQAERFDFDALLDARWRLSPQSDRRGLRLEGPRLENRGEPEVEPEGNAPGAVQVPGSGQPIILGPDRPVTGGYPKIATVLTDDLPRLAQARPGAEIRFRRA